MPKKVSIARLLKAEEDKVVTKKKKSLVKDIDEACLKGMNAPGRYSFRAVKRFMKKMVDVDDRDTFFLQFFQLYNMVMSPVDRTYGVFHPSGLLDGCKRAMAFELNQEEKTDKVVNPFPPEILRTFDVGTWYHIYFQAMLFNMGVLEMAEVPVVNEEKYLSGHADGVFKAEVFGEKVLLEIKTMNSFQYKKAIFRPFKKHEFQASLYARELGIDKVLYLYINKDTSEIKDFLMPLFEEQLVLADEKMDEVIADVKAKRLPCVECKDKYSAEAMKCPFRSKCFEYNKDAKTETTP